MFSPGLIMHYLPEKRPARKLKKVYFSENPLFRIKSSLWYLSRLSDQSIARWCPNHWKSISPLPYSSLWQETKHINVDSTQETTFFPGVTSNCICIKQNIASFDQIQMWTALMKTFISRSHRRGTTNNVKHTLFVNPLENVWFDIWSSNSHLMELLGCQIVWFCDEPIQNMFTNRLKTVGRTVANDEKNRSMTFSHILKC